MAYIALFVQSKKKWVHSVSLAFLSMKKVTIMCISNNSHFLFQLICHHVSKEYNTKIL